MVQGYVAGTVPAAGPRIINAVFTGIHMLGICFCFHAAVDKRQGKRYDTVRTLLSGVADSTARAGVPEQICCLRLDGTAAYSLHSRQMHGSKGGIEIKVYQNEEHK